MELRMIGKILYSENLIHFGLLVLRIALGVAFIVHGFPKLFGASNQLFIGKLTAVGIPGGDIAVRLAGGAQFLGGITLMIGFLVRPTALVLAFTMGVAVFMHIELTGGIADAFTIKAFSSYSHALEDGIVFLALIFIGPGKYSLDSKLFGRS
ncbi:MAG TPA: DoxX family protein [Spirochaetes bacterium]|nr:DoxX family protein [Spirochaetota bacterium]